MYTKTRQDCLNVQPVHIKLVRYPDTQVYVLLNGGVDGMVLPAGYLHASTGKVMHDKSTFDIRPDQQVHLFLSKFPGWYHGITFSPLHTRYVCSCGKFCANVASMLEGMAS